MKTYLALALATLCLAGCFGEENGDLKDWMRDSSEGLRGKVEPLPEVKPYQPFTYDAFSLPDPFRPSKMEIAKGKGGGTGLRPNPDRPKEVLENYDLEKLRMVGTLQQGKLIQALVRAPDGNLYRVKLGSYMGQNFGMVTAISETEVKLKEIVEDSGGDWVERETSLSLDDAEQKK
ncbi:type IV pilus assembly protein PilP [Andreprevotia lacus DSM 23236]|jgi:type IV pilus assembly protein PilP|uniref:Type IV pilus assembly protein PilP n=1 Tax=Andreprevotia lacus DSM 23236 TaxID=1121001 RepID=A0A1W1Y193_9NEIS|nr:pilus assembly protein PilP [Andreprevotia lacus]SMC29894.1 type IV pilus assembly protein PilP [Andreprevotia lacus DSM 23236]